MELAALLLKYLPLAVLVFDASGKLLYVNEAAFNLWQLPTQEAVGQTLLRLLPWLAFDLPAGEPAVIVPEVCRRLQDGRVICREGRRFYCRMVPLPENHAGGPTFMLLAEAFDDAASLAGRISQEERLAGVMEISNTLTHKLNQYLQVIMGYVSLLTLEIPEEQNAHGYLTKIMEQLENIRLTLHRLNNITNYAVIERPDGRRMFDLDRAIANADRHFR